MDEERSDDRILHSTITNNLPLVASLLVAHRSMKPGQVGLAIRLEGDGPTNTVEEYFKNKGVKVSKAKKAKRTREDEEGTEGPNIPTFFQTPLSSPQPKKKTKPDPNQKKVLEEVRTAGAKRQQHSTQYDN